MVGRRSDGAPVQVTQAGEFRSARIESLRALAALGVFASHILIFSYGPALGSLDDETVLRTAFTSSVHGVDLFFALSGYLLYWPFARRDLAGGPDVDVRRYARNRVLRILPLYLAAVWIVLLVQEHGGTFEQWLLLSTFSGNFEWTNATAVLPVTWSLVNEVHFYLLLPLAAWVIGRLSSGRPGRALAIVLAAAGASILFRAETYTATTVLTRPGLVLSLPGTFVFFATGMALAVVRARWQEHAGRLPRPLLHADVWVVGAAVLWLASTLSIKPPFELFIAPAAFLLIGACALPLAPGRLPELLLWRPLAAVGLVSYSVYLWHYPLLKWLDDVYPYASDSRLLLLAALPLVLAVSAASYLLIERPFLRLRRRWSTDDGRPAQPPRDSHPATPLPARAE